MFTDCWLPCIKLHCPIKQIKCPVSPVKTIITKTCLYNFDPLKPHFYIVKLGFAGVYIIFLIYAKNIDCGYSLEPPKYEQKYEKYQNFLSENFQFLVVNCSIYLNRHVSVMDRQLVFYENHRQLVFYENHRREEGKLPMPFLNVWMLVKKVGNLADLHCTCTLGNPNCGYYGEVAHSCIYYLQRRHCMYDNCTLHSDEIVMSHNTR